MPIHQNALAMGSRLHLSASPATSSAKSSPATDERPRKFTLRRKATDSPAGSTSFVITAPSPPMFGSSRQRERRAQGPHTSSPSTPSSIQSSSYFPSPCAGSSFVSTPATTPSRSNMASPSSAAASPSVPTQRKSMFNLRNLSAVNLVNRNKQSAKQPAALVGLGVQGMFTEDVEFNEGAARIVTAEELVRLGPMIQRAPIIHPRQPLPAVAQPQYYYPTTVYEDYFDDTSSVADSEDEDFTSYRHSFVNEFPAPPLVPPKEVMAEISLASPPRTPYQTTARFEVPAALPNSLQELLALKAETAQMYSAILTPAIGASPAVASTSAVRKTARKAVPTLRMSQENLVEPTKLPAKPFYNNYRATQSVMVFSSKPSFNTCAPLPIPVTIPSRKESLTPTLASSPAFTSGITRFHIPAPLGLSSRRNSFGSSSSGSADGNVTPALTSCSGTSTKSFSTSSERGSSHDRSPSFHTAGPRLLAPPAPNPPFLRKPTFQLEVAVVDDSDSHHVERPSRIAEPVSPKTLQESKKKSGFWNKARKALSA